MMTMGGPERLTGPVVAGAGASNRQVGGFAIRAGRWSNMTMWSKSTFYIALGSSLTMRDWPFLP
jgi:hypothetical protein